VLSLSEREIAELRDLVVDAHRILAANGCAADLFGQASARIDETTMLVRCRRPDEPGIAFTRPADVLQVGFDAARDDELPLHAAIYRARPEVNGIVHVHARYALLCGMLGLPLLPIVAAYDTWALEVAERPVPAFPRAVAIDTAELAREVAATLGTADVCLLHGHGLVAVGTDLRVATVRAIKLETLAEITVQSHTAGRAPTPFGGGEVTAKLESWRPNAPTYARWIWDFYHRKLTAPPHAR
jgi:ribulose-5-phosphate 4-epimerase/fuculose-1-phosphate aldolase